MNTTLLFTPPTADMQPTPEGQRHLGSPMRSRLLALFDSEFLQLPSSDGKLCARVRVMYHRLEAAKLGQWTSRNDGTTTTVWRLSGNPNKSHVTN